MKMKFQVLHEKAVQISRVYLKAESDLIAVLQEIDDCRGYRELSFKSLFEYATQGLGLTESVTYNLITVARKSKEVPKLQEMIRNQEVSISNARMIAPVLTFENQDRWLSAAASMSKRSLEKEIARERPELAVQERVRFVADERLEVKVGISQALHEKLTRVQDLVSSQFGQAADLEKTLEALVDLYIEKKDPVEKAKRAEAREEKREIQSHKKTAIQPVPGQVTAKLPMFSQPNLGTVRSSKASLRYIPAKLEHAILLRDQGRCTYQTRNGQRCLERRWLDIHHVQPLSEGGVTALENLKLVCRGHHKVVHHYAKNPAGSSTPFSFKRSMKVGTKPVHLNCAPSGDAVKIS